jgi:diguanylate cyclase (GGDEF)-like protein
LTEIVTSLLVLTAVVLAGTSLGLLLANYRYPTAIRRALTLYAGANVLVATGNLIITFCESRAPQLAQILDLGIAGLGTPLFYFAFRSIQDRPFHHRIVWPLYGLALVGVLIGCSIERDVSIGLLSLDLLDIVLFSLVARDLLTNFRGRGRAHYFTGYANILFIALLVGSAIVLVTGPRQTEITEWFANTGAFGLGATCFAAAIGAVNFLLLCNDEFNQRLLTMAATDPLTGLANRRKLMERGAEEIVRLQRFKQPLTLIMIDLDHFKVVNDTHGHAIGDQVLKETAHACVGTLRDIDMVARAGGEEFAILLPQTPLARALEVAERLRQAIARIDIAANSARVTITASLGVAEHIATDTSIDQLMIRADRALYRSKADGRNRVSHELAEIAAPSVATS